MIHFIKFLINTMQSSKIIIINLQKPREFFMNIFNIQLVIDRHFNIILRMGK